MRAIGRTDQAKNKKRVTRPAARGIPLLMMNMRAEGSAARKETPPSRTARQRVVKRVDHDAELSNNHQVPRSRVQSTGPHIDAMKFGIAGMFSGAAFQASGA